MQKILTAKKISCKPLFEVRVWRISTGKSLSEALIFESTKPQYDHRLFIELKFAFSKKAAKFDEIFTVYLTPTTSCQIDDEDFFNFCGLLR